MPQIAYFTVLPRVLALTMGCGFGAKMPLTEKEQSWRTHIPDSKLTVELTVSCGNHGVSVERAQGLT